MIELFASYYLIVLWGAMIVYGGRNGYRYLMVIGFLFMATANINSFLDAIPEVQAALRIILNTMTFLFLIYTARRLHAKR